LPTCFPVAADGRAASKIQFGRSLLQEINYIGLFAFLTGLVTLFVSVRRRLGFLELQRAGLVILLLGAYSFMIAFGRSLERGLIPTLVTNVYYAYVPMLAAAAGAALVIGPSGPTSHSAPSDPPAQRAGKTCLAAGLSILIGLNAWATYQLCRTYR